MKISFMFLFSKLTFFSFASNKDERFEEDEKNTFSYFVSLDFVIRSFSIDKPEALPSCTISDPWYGCFLANEWGLLIM